MSKTFGGKIVQEETGLPIVGLWLRRLSNGSELWLRTGDDGRFHFPGAEHDAPDVVDLISHAGKSAGMLAFPNDSDTNLVVPVPGAQLADASYRQGISDAVLRAEVFALARAALPLLPPDERARAGLLLDALPCGLPPIARMADVVDLAIGTLEGHAGAAERFRDRLLAMESWNTDRHGPHDRPDDDEIASVFSGGHTHEHDVRQISDPDRLIEIPTIAVLTIATIRAAEPESGARWQAIQTLHAQLASLAPLRALLRDARALMAQESGAARAFLGTLAMLGGICLPVGSPGSGQPLPVSLPVPRPGPWHQPPGLPGINEDCVEIIREVVAAMERRARFEVAFAEGVRACPGETLRLEGSGLMPGDSLPRVGFRSEHHRGVIFVTADHADDSSIEVVVPDGATCGPLELVVPVSEPINACGRFISVNATQTGDPVQFLGGRTRITSVRTPDAGCLRAGDDIDIHWRTCNADRIIVTIATTGYGQVEPSGDVTTVDAGIGHHRITVPPAPDGAHLVVTIRAEGPCGVDEKVFEFGVARPARDRAFDFANLSGVTNWHRNIVWPSIGRYAPETLEELVDAVRFAERLQQRLGVEGSRWSYTDCIAPRRSTRFVIDTSNLNAPVESVVPAALRPDVRSVLSSAALGTLDAASSSGGRPAPPPLANRLVHVEAGIKLYDLNCRLDELDEPLCIPNLGGSRGQSLAGAINTGTHGATTRLPPIPDLVRAIHLVGNGGQQWWIERRSAPVTDEQAMRRLMARGVLDPCLELHYEDALFSACLVGVGHAGIVYAYVIETVPQHNLEEDTTLTNWTEARSRIQRHLTGDRAEMPWYFEVSVNPAIGRPAWITTRTPTTRPADPRPAPMPPLSDAVIAALLGASFASGAPGAVVGLGAGLIAIVVGAVSSYFARRFAEYTAVFTNPAMWFRIPEIQQEIDLIEHLISAATDLAESIAAAVDGDSARADEELTQALPNIINAFWRIGLFVADGRHILDAVQTLFTNIDQRPPGSRIGKSYTILCDQIDCNPQTHSRLEQLIHSQEYAVDANALVAFTEAVLEAADHVRNAEDDALIVVLNLRMTQATTASVGCQQYPLTGLLEIWTVDGLEGNTSFHRRIDAIVEDFGALPHWGHVHRARDLSTEFTRSATWRAELDRIARHAGWPNTFRHDFARRRGLLSDLT